ncbi:MAG: hypothetical protein AAF234_16795 [Pseudomonadota bacterium]
MNATTSAQEPQLLENADASLLIYRDAPDWEDRKTAALGSFKFGTAEGGIALLRQAADQLKNEGFGAVIGPMDGDTWHSYRAVTQSDDSPTFLMEPQSGAHDVAALEAAGFHTISGYVSARTQTEQGIAKRRGGRKGLEILTWDGTSPEAFFGDVYDFSLAGFSRNRFYKPISKETFLGMYMPYVPFLKRELILFARRDSGALVGFLFGIPDFSLGPQTNTAILKTYASSVFGAGHLLADVFHRNALELGLTTTIHALMHEDNIARQRSEKLGGSIFRHYHLFGRVL